MEEVWKRIGVLINDHAHMDPYQFRVDLIIYSIDNKRFREVLGREKVSLGD